MNEWQEWLQRQKAKLAEDVPAPKPAAQKEPVVTRPITVDELRMVKRLQGVSWAWWCGDGRFITQFEDATPETQVTERQAWWIRCLMYKYRKQTKYTGPKPDGYTGRR